jgi:hypothetical protein
MACPDHRHRAVNAVDTFDHRFDAPATGFVAEQTGLDHPCVVHHQQIAGIQQIGQVAEGTIDQ